MRLRNTPNKVKTQFIEKSAKLVSETVSKHLNKEITALKEDINVARENDFALSYSNPFASEYANSYLNEKSETSKLPKIVDLKEKQIEEAKAEASKALEQAEAKATEPKRINEAAERNKVINGLIEPLSKDQREIMTDLLNLFKRRS